MAEYNQDQSTGLRSELDEPRRTTDQVKSGDFGTAPQGQQQGGGYGGVGEDEPPQHKIHSDSEPLPKPDRGTYGEELPRSEPREEQVLPKPTDGEEYGDAPQSTGGYQGYRDTHPSQLNEGSVDSEPRSYETEAQEKSNPGYTDPSEAFRGAPVDRKLEEPGYGYDQKRSEPAVGSSEPALDSTPAETGTPKKEGLVTKIKEMLPGHHHKPADTAVPDTTTDTAASPKKGLITKIKEKLPGHHSTTTNPY